MITTVFLTLFQIIKIKFNKRNRINEEIIYLNTNLYNFIFGFLYLISLIIWLILLKIEIQEVDYLLKQDYVSNVFQLLNFEYLENLRKYFYDNSMIMKNYYIVYFLKQLPYMLFWTNFSLWMSILFFYKGYQKNIIYETGILVNSAIIDWNKIIDYKWSNIYKKGYLIKVSIIIWCLHCLSFMT